MRYIIRPLGFALWWFMSGLLFTILIGLPEQALIGAFINLLLGLLVIALSTLTQRGQDTFYGVIETEGIHFGFLILIAVPFTCIFIGCIVAIFRLLNFLFG